ncbi:MAG: hypothetical protein QOF33_4247 [Thermomicrobiales bacterium]|nr:hypothetical protein [Thermomicrobiales bacterium]MEA2527778.1 hypothetical protein [Thermomicrobiales bacterium]MEA2528799.1 hypothetical protein [Thermomicrobiales bacterium]MEA2586162.1 hypothetical protein [Thermomicrobiales bacterium]
MQERRDLAIILSAWFVVLLVGEFVVAALLTGAGDAARTLPLMIVIAIAGTLFLFVVLVVVAYFDAQARRDITRDASRLEHIIQQQRHTSNREHPRDPS